MDIFLWIALCAMFLYIGVAFAKAPFQRLMYLWLGVCFLALGVLDANDARVPWLKWLAIGVLAILAGASRQRGEPPFFSSSVLDLKSMLLLLNPFKRR